MDRKTLERLTCSGEIERVAVAVAALKEYWHERRGTIAELMEAANVKVSFPSLLKNEEPEVLVLRTLNSRELF